MGFPVVLVAWVVLRELGSLKSRKKGSLAHPASPAVQFIHSCLKRQEPRLWGQSMQQALEGNRHRNAKNKDDEILQCCLQYQTLHPESTLISCTTIRSYAARLLSGVKALCQADLAEESRKSHVSALPRTPTKILTPPFTQQPSSSSSSLGHTAPDGGKTVEQDSVLAALRESCELLDTFGKTKECYGGRVSTAVATLDTIERRLVSQPEHVTDEAIVGDAMMSDNEEKQALPAAASHQEVWALFENIWANLCQISSALFAALHFDPGTMRRTVPEGAPPPPEDVLACLHTLPPMVTQLLRDFCRVLSSDIGMEESQALLSFIHASQIVSINTQLCTRDLVACFSDHREKLKVGGTQLTELKVSLDNCVTAMTQSNPTWPLLDHSQTSSTNWQPQD